MKAIPYVSLMFVTACAGPDMSMYQVKSYVIEEGGVRELDKRMRMKARYLRAEFNVYTTRLSGSTDGLFIPSTKDSPP